MGRPWTRLWLDDFDKGVMGLTPQEGWAYTRLLVWMYQEEGPIKRMDKLHAALCNMDIRQYRHALKGLIERGKIREVEGRLTNDRVEVELKSVADLSAVRSEMGKRGGRSRGKKDNEINGTHVATAKDLPEQTESKALATVKQNNSETDIDKETPVVPTSVPHADRLLQSLIHAIGGQPQGMRQHKVLDVGDLMALIAVGYREEDIIAKARAKADFLMHHARSWAVLAGFIEQDCKPKPKPLSPIHITERQWSAIMNQARRSEEWFADNGPAPGQDGCLAPKHLLQPSDAEVRWYVYPASS